ncbi:TonB-dependent receptor [Shewanella avicenniae]|uniref:TonB-dependent receptor n=1 Tax=Shewanella avicenniae TaxID=2814294 RepID=A0ABX7QTV8_9GAMM|nr:TonB-dependent receptor [Shewanella avicenniae]QSX34922.1 TonB-dependent receptor [Shewanella avicenniae]
MIVKKNALANAVSLAIVGGVFAASFSTVVRAEEADTAKVERIEVTGSRIKRTDVETSSPVMVMDATQIKQSGYDRVEDILNQLPQIEAAENSFLANGATGTATLDLRGLGSNRTLVLINGRRMQAGSIYSQSADVNQIPASLIKRVEVLTGGAAAVYGADAVAGVVNFVMNDDFEGFQLNAGASGYQHNNDNKYIQGLMDNRGYDYPEGSSGVDGKAYSIDLTMGGNFAEDKGHATVYAVWRRNDELKQGTRDYSSCALNSGGTACGGSSTAPIPYFDIFPVVDGEVDFTQEYWGHLDPNGPGFVEDDGYRYNYAPVNHFMRPNERFSAGAFVNYEVNDYFRPYMEVSFMHNRTAGQIAESGTFFNNELLMDYNNPLMNDAQKAQLQEYFGQTPDDQFVMYIGKRNVEGGPRSDNLEHTSYRILTGVEGDLNDSWSYDISYNYSATTSSSIYINDLLATQIPDRVGAVGTECVEEDGCLYYNVFEVGGVTAEQADQLTGVGTLNGIVKQAIYNGFVSGEFDFGLPTTTNTIGAVFGLERRELDYERTADTIYSEGLLLGQGGPTENLSGEINVNEVFAEFAVPVLDTLNVNLAGRLSDFSTTGTDFTYSVGADYTVADAYKFRASYAKAVRAPNVSELFSSNGLGLWDGDDPCGGAAGEILSAEQCARTGVSASQYGNITDSPANQYNEMSGGNTELEPEEAKTYTVGVVANPFDTFHVSVDYFRIEMEKVIDTIGASTILENCALTGDATFCDNVVRSPSGSLWLGQEGYVNNALANIGGRTWEGVDINSGYKYDIFNGTLALSLNGFYSMKKEIEPILGDSELAYDCSGKISSACFASPKWRHTLNAEYIAEDYSVALKWRYYGKVDYEGSVDVLTADGISSYSFFDLSGNYAVNDYLTVTAGVNNIFDKEPPMVGGTLSTNANTVAGFYDSLGRFMFMSVGLKF